MTGVRPVPPSQAGAPPVSGPLSLAASGSAEETGLAAYAKAVTVNCPFLAASLRRGQTRWHRYQARPGTPQLALESGVFAAGVWAAEQVRVRRPSSGTGVCEVIAVDVADPSGTVLQWPHWALKQAYAPVGVMFGKFAPADVRTDRHHRPVPAPPLAVLAVRPALPAIDPDLLPSTPDLARVIAEATDDGHDVFPSGTEDAAASWPAVRKWSEEKRAPR